MDQTGRGRNQKRGIYIYPPLYCHGFDETQEMGDKSDMHVRSKPLQASKNGVRFFTPPAPQRGATGRDGMLATEMTWIEKKKKKKKKQADLKFCTPAPPHTYRPLPRFVPMMQMGMSPHRCKSTNNRCVCKLSLPRPPHFLASPIHVSLQVRNPLGRRAKLAWPPFTLKIPPAWQQHGRPGC